MEKVTKQGDVTRISNEFMSSTGLHGINKVHPESASFPRRIAWLLLVLGSTGYLSYVLYTELHQYYTYPMSTTSRVQRQDVMSFPAVTVCNMSPLNYSRIRSQDPRYENAVMYVSDNWKDFATTANWSDPFYQNYLFQSPVTVDDVLNESMVLEHMFVGCKFDGISFNCSDMAQVVITDVGPCFTFNADGKTKTSEIGANFNLLLKVFIDQANYFVSYSEGSGVKVIIHEPGELPNVFNRGFVVSPGTMTYVSIEKHTRQHLQKPFKAFTDDYCVDTESPDFTNPNTLTNYSVYTCEMECRLNLWRRRVGCSVAMFPSFGPPYCSLMQMIEFYESPGESGNVRTDVRNVCNQRCQTPCTSTTFSAKVSYAEYPSEYTHSRASHQMTNSTLEFLRHNTLKINIYYERLETVFTEQVPLYKSIGDVLANIGGQMGLFLGASILTFMEVVEFCWMMIVQVSWGRWKKNRTKPQDAFQQEKPNIKM